MSRLLRVVLPVVSLGLAASAVLPATASSAELAPAPLEHYPDAAVAAPYSGFVGRDTRETQRVRVYLTEAGHRQRARVEVCNRYGRLGKITLRGGPGGERFGVRYQTRAGADITRPVIAGTYGFRLAVGECRYFRVVVIRRAAAPNGSGRTFELVARPSMEGAYRDRIGVIARAVAPEPPHQCFPGGPGEPDVCS